MKSRLDALSNSVFSWARKYRQQQLLLSSCCLLLITLLPLTAHAQIATPNGSGVGVTSDGTPRGAAAGTMIAAALETAGYHAQQQVLQNLSGHLETAGALIIVGVVLSAVLSVAVFGSYQSALWLLVGPPVFFFASGINIPVGGAEPVRVNASGAEWRFGAFEDTENVTQRYTPRPATNASVSLVFHKYNEFVSEMSQKAISTITNQDIAKQMIFSARQRTVQSLFGERIRDAGVEALSSYFMVHCNTEIGDARTLAIFKHEVESGIKSAAQARQDPVYQAASARYCERFPEKDKVLTRGPWLNYVYTLPQSVRAAAHFPVSDGEHHSRLSSEDVVVSCEDMWRWVVYGSMQAAQSQMETWAHNNFPWYSWRIFDSQIWNRALEDIREKFVTNTNPTVNTNEALPDPCPMAINISVSDGIMDSILRMTSALMIRKIMTEGPNQQLFHRIVSSHDGIVPQEGAAKVLSTNPSSRRSQLERQAASKFADGKRYEVYTFIHLMPYIQGFLLYALSLLYPFFTLLILVPGQAGQFFTWMALWAWVKSWDVGWALIMVADEVLWELMPKHGYFNPDNEAAFSTPVNLLEGAFGGDPAYSVAFYWTLLGTMVFAVPLVSGQMILGAKRAIAGRLFDGSESIKGWAENYGESAGRYVASYQVGQYTRQTAQNSALSQMRRGVAASDTLKQGNDNVTKANEGLLTQSVQNAPSAIQHNADAILGPQAKLLGGLIGYVEGLTGSSGTGNAPAGESNAPSNGNSFQRYGNAADARTQKANEPGGQRDQVRDRSRSAGDNYVRGRVYPLAAKYLPNRIASNWMYGGNLSAGEIDELANAQVMSETLRQAGIEADLLQEFVADPAANKMINDMHRASLYRRAHAEFAHTDAEGMTALTFMTAMAGGPTGANLRNFLTTGLSVPLLRRNIGYISQQHDIGFGMARDEELFNAQIQYSAFDHHKFESSYDMRNILASEAEAYLSSDRGGEFFAIEYYDPNLVYQPYKAMLDADTRFQRSYGELEGNTARWAFQPIIWGASETFGRLRGSGGGSND